ncbi:hypothetical protein [Caballeronia sordidicola]|uniref:Lipoprotein n=1 Tax=Caballeronia sordidicola TaxID=196367 RepID=A0A226X6H3_CABSO|nr:hypothetical protein [Caballeronia sordidicola]OXC78610.1 hypothetical protein BSU04_10800 [Caballeronia sordidicola]
MKKLIVASALMLLLAACSAPKPPQPTGAWVPVNHPIATQGAQE